MPKAPSPPQELGIANPRAARVCIPSQVLKFERCEPVAICIIADMRKAADVEQWGMKNHSTEPC